MKLSFVMLITLTIIALLAGCSTQTAVLKQSVNHQETGNKMLRIGKLESAADHFRQILTEDPKDAAANFGLGQVYLERDDDFRAEQFFLKALRYDPSLSIINGYLGQIYLDRGDEKLAMEYYAKCDSDDPHYAEYHYRLGRDFLLKGERMKAKEQFLMALTHETFWGGHWGMGKLKYNVGEHEEALKHFVKATSLSDNPDANYSTAECMFSLGMDEQAYFYYLRYIAELPHGDYADEARQNVKQIQNNFENLETYDKIKFNLKSDKNIAINIYDEEGYHLKTLYKGLLCRGNNYEMPWDGIDEKGNLCSGSNFFGIVSCGDSTIIQKLVPISSSSTNNY